MDNWLVVHHHENGADYYLFRSDHEPTLEEAQDAIDYDESSFEPGKGEWLETQPLGEPHELTPQVPR